MIFFYVLIFVLSLVGAQFVGSKNEKPFNGALDRSQTDAIKGIFILVVFGSHIFGYIQTYVPILNEYDRLFISTNSLMRQLIVVMFLFYSGYGVAESICSKGSRYITSMPRKRILITWLNFSVAVCFFIVVGLLIGTEISVKRGLLSLLGWEDIGNSNWYIFCILILYIITYVAFKFFLTKNVRFFVTLILTILYILIVQTQKDGYWVDTALAYPAGIALSLYKDYFLKLVQKYYKQALIVFVMLFLVIAFFLWWIYKYSHIKTYFIPENLSAVLFGYLIVLVNMRIRIENAPLKWLGKNLFPIYIYQRLPMILIVAIADGYFVKEHKYLYVIISLILTLLIAYLYKYFTIKDYHLEKLFKR